MIGKIMATIHLLCGFLGFGKTTIARRLEKSLPARRFTHDDIMFERYGRNPDDFAAKYKDVDDYIRAEAAECIAKNQDAVMDYGFWSYEKRREYYAWAKTLTDNVVFHVVYCDILMAKQRVSARTKKDKNSLFIDENMFASLLQKYEPWSSVDKYPVVLHNASNFQYIGKTVMVKIDRPMKSKHPKYGFEYPVNYGFVPFTISGDGEELDAYVLGVDKPIDKFIGKCVAVVHRTNDNDDKLIVVPEDMVISDEETEAQIAFQEKWFKHILVRSPNVTKTHFGVYGSVIRDDKILLIKKARGPYTGLYDLPGGSQEKDEEYLQTLKREIAEETGCEVIRAENERYKSVIFADFTLQSGEKGVLQHNAILYDVEISGAPQTTGDGLDSNGAVWVDIDDLTAENATPYALIAAGKPMISVADKNDNVIAAHIRGTPLKPNRYVRIAAVLVFNSKGNLIMQKIAAHKKGGGKWLYSAAGHVDAGEDYKVAAQREMKEEIGTTAPIEKEVVAFPVIREGRQIAFHHVFIAHSDAPIVPDQSEVAEIREIPVSELKKLIEQHPEQFFDAFLTALKLYFDGENNG